MPKFRKKPIVVDVEGPLTEPTMVQTANGPVEAGPGDYVLTDPKTGDTWPINAEIFAKTYDKAYGEPVNFGISVTEDPPEEGNGIRFYIIVRVDRHTFGLANAKDGRNLVRRQFQYALPETLKLVDQEHATLNAKRVKTPE